MCYIKGWEGGIAGAELEIKLFMFFTSNKQKSRNNDVKCECLRKRRGEKKVVSWYMTIRTEQMVGNALSVDGSVEWSRPSRITEPYTSTHPTAVIFDSL